MKNRLVSYLLRLWPGKKRFAAENGRFLIVSTTGLGDTLWATPALRALREKYPRAYIGVLTSVLGKEVLLGSPYIDEFFVFKGFFSLFAIYRALNRRGFGTVCIFHSSQRAVLALCGIVGASRVIGSKGINKGLDGSLLTDAISAKPMHEIARRMQLVSVYGCTSSTPLLELYPDARAHREVEAFLKKHRITERHVLIGVHPGAKDLFKRWSPACLAQVANRLSQHLGAQVIITGSAQEQALVETLAQKIEGAITVVGELSVQGLALLLKKMVVFITGDTGPMHVAFAMNTPTVALFCPTDPYLCGPYLASKVVIVQAAPTCTPCLKKQCRLPFCLLQISPDHVYDAALKLIY